MLLKSQFKNLLMPYIIWTNSQQVPRRLGTHMYIPTLARHIRSFMICLIIIIFLVILLKYFHFILVMLNYSQSSWTCLFIYRCNFFPSWNFLGLISRAETFAPLEERLGRTRRQGLSSMASGVSDKTPRQEFRQRGIRWNTSYQNQDTKKHIKLVTRATWGWVL